MDELLDMLLSLRVPSLNCLMKYWPNFTWNSPTGLFVTFEISEYNSGTVADDLI